MTWAPDYVSVDTLRRYLRLPDSGDVGEPEEDADNDAVYGPAITAASRAIDTSCSRQFGSTAAAARYYTPRWAADLNAWVCEVDDFMSVSGLAILADLDNDGTYEITIDVADVHKSPSNAAANGKPWTLLRFLSGPTLSANVDSLSVSTPWGWTAVPDDIAAATLLQASKFSARRNSPYGIAGSPDLGNELRLLKKLDVDVELMLNGYRRYW